MGRMAVPFDAGKGAAFFAAGDDRDAGIEVGFAAFGGEGATRSAGLCSHRTSSRRTSSRRTLALVADSTAKTPRGSMTAWLMVWSTPVKVWLSSHCLT